MEEFQKSQTLKQSLQDWVDVDVAMYYVAIALGLTPVPEKAESYWGNRKDIFWSNNPLGTGLFHVLEMLTSVGVLEKSEDNFYRWHPDFDWTKY